MKKHMKKLTREIIKIGKQVAKDLAIAIVKSAAIVALKEFVMVPLMKKLKGIYDRNPEMERQYGL